MKSKKSLGIGSLSLLLFFGSTILLYAGNKGYTAGSYLMELLGLRIHEVVIAIIILIIAVLLAKKYSDHLFAKSGIVSSSILLGLILITVIADLLIRSFNFVF